MSLAEDLKRDYEEKVHKREVSVTIALIGQCGQKLQ